MISKPIKASLCCHSYTWSLTLTLDWQEIWAEVLEGFSVDIISSSFNTVIMTIFRNTGIVDALVSRSIAVLCQSVLLIHCRSVSWSQSQLKLGASWDKPRTGGQSIAGLTQRQTNFHTDIHTYGLLK